MRGGESWGRSGGGGYSGRLEPEPAFTQGEPGAEDRVGFRRGDFVGRRLTPALRSTFEERPAVASFFGETIDVGTTTHFYEVVVLDPESLGIKKTETLTPTVAFLDTMEDLSTEGLKPRQVVDLSGVIAGHKINGIAFPTNRRLQTVFRYKPSK